MGYYCKAAIAVGTRRYRKRPVRDITPATYAYNVYSLDSIKNELVLPVLDASFKVVNFER